MSKLKAVFLDRDGIINIDKRYLYTIEDFEFVPGIIDILKYLQKRSFLLFIITNQSGINRGFYTHDDFHKLTQWMCNKLSEKDILISKIEYCPHQPSDNCNCRKPKTGMIENILKEFNIDLENSWLIGDKNSDIECAINIGISNTILFDNGKYDINNIAKYTIYDIKKIKEIIC